MAEVASAFLETVCFLNRIRVKSTRHTFSDAFGAVLGHSPVLAVAGQIMCLDIIIHFCIVCWGCRNEIEDLKFEFAVSMNSKYSLEPPILNVPETSMHLNHSHAGLAMFFHRPAP